LTNSLDTLSATIQPVDLPQSSLLQTTDQTTSHSIENSPKRLRLDRTSKKDNQKAIPNKQATNSNETSTASSIHCPICLETLDEVIKTLKFEILLFYFKIFVNLVKIT
jgi:hypothetical protein